VYGAGPQSAHTESIIYPWFTSNAFYPSINNSGGEDVGTSTSSLGLFAASRTTSTTSKGWIRGVLNVSSSNTYDISAPPQNFNFYTLAINNVGTPGTYDTRQLSMVFIGSGNIDQLQFYNIFQMFATQQNFNV
jgi:hypothetical protein